MNDLSGGFTDPALQSAIANATVEPRQWAVVR